MTHTTKWVTGLIGLLLLGWLLFGFFGVQALFMNKVVDEPIPEPQRAQTEPAIATSSTPTTVESPVVTERSSPNLLAEGSFQQGDSTYSIRGKATITEQNGVRTIALTDFDVTNGPDLFVYVVSAADAQNSTVKDAVKEQRFVNIGTLKGNRGNQTYTLPPELELNDQSTVSIWCRRFSRNFGAADLTITQ